MYILYLEGFLKMHHVQGIFANIKKMRNLRWISKEEWDKGKADNKRGGVLCSGFVDIFTHIFTKDIHEYTIAAAAAAAARIFLFFNCEKKRRIQRERYSERLLGYIYIYNRQCWHTYTLKAQTKDYVVYSYTLIPMLLFDFQILRWLFFIYKSSYSN